MNFEANIKISRNVYYVIFQNGLINYLILTQFKNFTMQTNKLDLTFLTDTEKAEILKVLERNDWLKKNHEAQLEYIYQL